MEQLTKDIEKDKENINQIKVIASKGMSSLFEISMFKVLKKSTRNDPFFRKGKCKCAYIRNICAGIQDVW